MAEVVQNSTQYLSDADLTAIAAYLKDPPPKTPQRLLKRTEIDKQAWSRGEALYVDNCTGCHMENGEGLAQAFPPIKGSSAVQAKAPDTVIHVVLAGAKIPATKGNPTGLRCPRSIGSSTTSRSRSRELIRNAWGNHASLTSADTVSKVRKNVEHGGG